MQKYIALLRGINVGGKNKVSMTELKRIFESLGYSNITTYINSGNIIFETTSEKRNVLELATTIEKALEKHFLFHVKTLIKTAESIIEISNKISKDWNNNIEQKTDVMFLWEEFNNKDAIKLIKINPEVDNLKYIDGAIIWNIQRKHYSKSGMNKFIGTQVYKNMTARNINTVRKLAELVK